MCLCFETSAWSYRRKHRTGGLMTKFRPCCSIIQKVTNLHRSVNHSGNTDNNGLKEPFSSWDEKFCVLWVETPLWLWNYKTETYSVSHKWGDWYVSAVCKKSQLCYCMFSVGQKQASLLFLSEAECPNAGLFNQGSVTHRGSANFCWIIDNFHQNNQWELKDYNKDDFE